MRTPKVPRGARHLRAYAEFTSYLQDFVQGLYPFLWVVGRSGITKTESIRAAVLGRSVYYRKGGQLTPAQFYIDCYEHRGQPVILDDAEHLLDNKIGAKLIAALADTGPAKLMSYASTSRVLGDIPQSFFTASSLCILAIRTTKDERIQSRGPIVYFDPTSLEIHRAVAGWFWTQEIHDWFGQHLYRLRPLDPFPARTGLDGSALAEEEPRILDLPAREDFAQPIRGRSLSATSPPRIVLDDTVGWERPLARDEDDEE